LDQKQKEFVAKAMAALDGNERQKLKERAIKARKLALTRLPSRPKKQIDLTHIEEDDEEEEQIDFKQRTPPLEEFIYKLLKEEQEASNENLDFKTGTVIAMHRKRCEVVVDGDTIDCILTTDQAKWQQSQFAVGDLAQVYQAEEVWRIHSIQTRRTKLSRPDPGSSNRERVIVANVDVIVVVVSVKAPPLHPRVIDRYLIAIERGGASAVIAVNKSDLLESEDEEFKLLDPYRGLAPVILVSAARKDGLDELKQHLHGKRSAFVGHSGVGKSSLLNALKPDLQLHTSAVSEGYGRGTHTTTSSHLWDLGEGTEIIDTPGVRAFGLFQLCREDLIDYFPEFSGFQCRFSNCSHTVEPGCGIIQAVREGTINSARFDSYQRILGTL
jgi:ribosome biogenesis GTPase / thiamine phosphate phosphatase